MKKIIFILIVVLFAICALNAQPDSENFYYYQGEKIFLQQKREKIFLKLTPKTSKEHPCKIYSALVKP